MEQRYRAIGDDASIQILAEYYAVPFEDLRWRLGWSRKALSRALHAAATNQTPITLGLWNGQEAAGKVVWWDLGAVGLDTGNGYLLIVQRHAVERWDPRAPEESAADADDPDGEDEE
jgi:sRNA-binding regulator protein Hfq